MRFALSQEHLKHFYRSENIEFELLISPKECKALNDKIISFIDEKCRKSDPKSYENLFKSVPEIDRLIHRNRISDFLYNLINRRPVWLIYDRYYEHHDLIDYKHDEDHDCSLLVYLKNKDKIGNGLFFKGEIPELSFEEDSSVLLLSFTYKRLSDNNPCFDC